MGGRAGSVCEGDCDRESDCNDGLYCFQRDGYTPVPGCKGTGKNNWDYCVPKDCESGWWEYLEQEVRAKYGPCWGATGRRVSIACALPGCLPEKIGFPSDSSG